MKQPVNILMVDDQPAKLLSYEAILADLGENLIKANSGNEALELLLRTDIAVVLVDVCMPGLDGFELASMIRSHPRFGRTAIILVSGVLTEDVDRLRGYDSGAVDYVSVPIVPGILRAKVSVFAELFRKTDELKRLNQELEERVAARTAEIQASAALLRQSEARLRLVLAAASIQGWTWDLRTNDFVWVGPPAEPEQGMQSFPDFMSHVHPDDRAAVQSAFDRAVSGMEDFSAEFRAPSEGKEAWWLGRGTVIGDVGGRPLSIAGININITARKLAEEERAVLLKNAEEARHEAEKANQLKDEFLAILSHELRTPLNAITGWTHMLGTGGLDAKTQAKAVETIHRNAMFQARLIADLLDVSRIVSGKLRLDLKAVDLPTVIQAALDAIRPAADAKNIELSSTISEGMEPVAGDPSRLQQVVSNMLSNAVKFTPAKGRVEVRLEKAGSKVKLTVADSGPGIRPDVLPYIFERFRQADSSTTRAHRGLGLGLAIARHIVETHGGAIRASNRKEGSGAVFEAVLPMSVSLVQALGGARTAPALPAEAVNWEPSSPWLKNVRILLTDDEADAREVVSLLLERSGAEVLVAASAAEALGILERERPDLLLADIEMPGEDGYSLIRKIRALPPARGGQTPAIAFTAYASSTDRSRLLDAGFDRHLPKPVQPPDLIALVAELAKPAREGTEDTISLEAAAHGGTSARA